MYINDLPLHLSEPNVRCSLFADDSTLDVSSSDAATISSSLQHSLEDVSQWCRENHMVLNPSKTKCMVITTRQKHQLHPPPLILSLNSECIKQVKEHKLLGIIIDDQLSWNAHVDHLCKVVSKNLFLLSKIVDFIDVPTRKMFYNAHIQSHIDYSSTVWDGCSEACFRRLNSLHRRAVRLILPKRTDSTEERMSDLDMLPLRKHLLFNKGVFMHKIINLSAPQYLTNLFRPSASRYNTRSNHLSVPRPRIDIFKSSIAYSGAHAWNTFPEKVTEASTVSTFRAHLFRHLKC